ncbi:hypothetical protein F0310_04315 (plasmid) [Borrelia sp. A-FGy1]|uniref:hypothetical protein n=1 Tax=Borrelia sp. A-FGy1 TaxID=2608247 RepID=UPI0015F59D5C|nr:hypothetical protein [Borrelia sp. A-FGy1]QMU99642.1 hypothetical protein F0310_04315 [Borrelia sp. A-FGy1]
MKMYRVLLILLVIIMSCGQQAAVDAYKEQIDTSNKRKNYNHQEYKVSRTVEEIEDEYDDIMNSVVLSSGLRKKVSELRYKYKRSKEAFTDGGYLRQFGNDFYKYNPAYTAPHKVDYIYASLNYEVDIIKKLIEVLNRLLIYDPYDGYVLVTSPLMRNLYTITQHEYDVLYNYLSDENLSKLIRSGELKKIRKVSILLDKFVKKKEDLIKRYRSQINIVVSKNHNKALIKKELNKLTGVEFVKGLMSLDEIVREIKDLV